MTARPSLSNPSLAATIGTLTLKNPVIAASGTCGYGLELADFCPPELLGAVIVKGLSAEPWPGRPGPRVVEAAGGLINAIGLQNMGARAFVNGPLAELKNRRAVVGANVVGRTVGEYLAATEILLDSPVDLLELNISCPNLAGPGGLSFGADPVAAAELTEAVAARVKGSGRPLWVKLPPLVSDIALLARTVEAAGADAISLINTLPGMAIDLETRRPKLGHAQGGLSGPPVKPLALRQVYLAARAVKIPVIGIGGISGAIDALEFLAAGAVAVQMGTAILVDPRSPARTIEGMAAWLEERSIPGLADVIGSLEI